MSIDLPEDLMSQIENSALLSEITNVEELEEKLAPSGMATVDPLD
jgi:hypothetical protein